MRSCATRAGILLGEMREKRWSKAKDDGCHRHDMTEAQDSVVTLQ